MHALPLYKSTYPQTHPGVPKMPLNPRPFWTLKPEGPLVLTLPVVLNICVFVPQVECNPLDILRKVTVAVREEGREERADITSTFDPENSSETQTETQDIAYSYPYPTFSRSLAVSVSKNSVVSQTVAPTPDAISTPIPTSSPLTYATPTSLSPSPFAAPTPTYALASVSASIAASTLVLNTSSIDCLDLTLSPTVKSIPNSDSNALLITLTILLGILLSIIVVVFLGVWVFRFRCRFGFGSLGRSELTTDGGDGQFSFNTNTESAVDRIESGVASRDVDIDIEDRKYAFGGSGPVPGVVPVLASEV